MEKMPAGTTHQLWWLQVLGRKSTYCPVQIFRAISVKQGYNKLKIDCYLWNVELCRGLGKLCPARSD